MTDRGVLLVVSPHLDDGVLSVGGLMATAAASGHRVLLATVFSSGGAFRSPAAVDYVAATGHDSSTFWRDRVIEDIVACSRVGAVPLHLGHLDACHREKPDGTAYYETTPDLFSKVDARDREEVLRGVVGDLMTVAHAWEPTWVVAPLSIGGHVDHQLTRQAALSICSDAALYGDTPYYDAGQPVPEALIEGRHGIAVRLGDTAVERKVDAVAAYKSQRRTLWSRRRGPWREQLLDLMRHSAGDVVENLWTVGALDRWTPLTG